MAGQMGRVKEFNPQEENITAYLERLQLYFECNGVEDAKRVPALLTLVGAKVYEVSWPQTCRRIRIMTVWRTF